MASENGSVAFTITHESLESARYVLRPDDAPIRIGRAPQNDIVVENRGVSKFHAELRLPARDRGEAAKPRALHVCVMDKSMNGTGIHLPESQWPIILNAGEEVPLPDGTTLLMPWLQKVQGSASKTEVPPEPNDRVSFKLHYDGPVLSPTDAGDEVPEPGEERCSGPGASVAEPAQAAPSSKGTAPLQQLPDVGQVSTGELDGQTACLNIFRRKGSLDKSMPKASADQQKRSSSAVKRSSEQLRHTRVKESPHKAGEVQTRAHSEGCLDKLDARNLKFVELLLNSKVSLHTTYDDAKKSLGSLPDWLRLSDRRRRIFFGVFKEHLGSSTPSSPGDVQKPRSTKRQQQHKDENEKPERKRLTVRDGRGGRALPREKLESSSAKGRRRAEQLLTAPAAATRSTAVTAAVEAGGAAELQTDATASRELAERRATQSKALQRRSTAQEPARVVKSDPGSLSPVGEPKLKHIIAPAVVQTAAAATPFAGASNSRAAANHSIHEQSVASMAPVDLNGHLLLDGQKRKASSSPEPAAAPEPESDEETFSGVDGFSNEVASPEEAAAEQRSVVKLEMLEITPAVTMPAEAPAQASGGTGPLDAAAAALQRLVQCAEPPPPVPKPPPAPKAEERCDEGQPPPPAPGSAQPPPASQSRPRPSPPACAEGGAASRLIADAPLQTDGNILPDDDTLETRTTCVGQVVLRPRARRIVMKPQAEIAEAARAAEAPRITLVPRNQTKEALAAASSMPCAQAAQASSSLPPVVPHPERVVVPPVHKQILSEAQARRLEARLLERQQALRPRVSTAA